MRKGEETKRQILDTAIDQFSKRGFSAVSIRDISGAVGIKESSVYNHYSSKKDILDAILLSYGEDLEKFLVSESIMQAGTDDNSVMGDAENFGAMSDEVFTGLATMLFRKMYLDERIHKLWQILSIERFNNAGMDELYRKYLFEDVLSYQTAIFSIMMQKGMIPKEDPELLAIEFYAPAFLLYQRHFATGFEDLSDDEKQRIENLFVRHVKRFRARMENPA
ncbi:MAG: TetR/AcrR family transcriptional regulator [Clostridiaceae bacterium]|nr:TetR/AcrR family transcriptional regulator [Clostridiaceae bacterium]